MVGVTLIAVFIAGIISFFSPCVVPLIPGFLAYLSGTKLSESKHARLKLFLNSLCYVLGFAVVFAILGVLLNGILLSVSSAVQLWLSRIGGIIIILFGLYTLGLLHIPALERDYKLEPKKFSITYVTSFVFGASFAVGWTPCVGAVLGSVITLSATQPGMSFALLLAYSIGLGIPFLIVGLFAEEALVFIRKLGPYFKYFNMAVGILLILLGVLVFTQTLSNIATLPFLSA
jgi:cytochrome c-type biogenesis protein